MNIQFSNVRAVIEVKVGKGGRVTGLKKYEGCTVKVVVFSGSLDERADQISGGSGSH